MRLGSLGDKSQATPSTSHVTMVSGSLPTSSGLLLGALSPCGPHHLLQDIYHWFLKKFKCFLR